jgi:hypothetical protein
MAEKIVSLDLSEIVEQKYLDYAKDVITDRAHYPGCKSESRKQRVFIYRQ